MAAKQSLEIGRLVNWAYGIELPKRQLIADGDAWSPITRYGSVGGMEIEGGSAPQRYAAYAPPHADALRIEQAVQMLPDELQLDGEAFRRQFMSDVLAITPAVDLFVIEANHGVTIVHATQRRALVKTNIGVRRRVFSKMGLVEMHAQRASQPKWNIGLPHCASVIGLNSKVEIIGECKGKNRYTSGSLCPLQWVAPTVEQLALARATYAVWRDGLADLAETLRGQLSQFEPLPPLAPPMPWISGDAVRSRVLPTLQLPNAANDARPAGHRSKAG